MSLFEELRRRNVFRVAAAYLVVGWVVLEVASIVAPALKLPDWTLTLLIFVGACGLPFAVIFAWAFELTPEGIKRTEDVAPTESITRETGGKLTRATIVLLSVALALVLGERFLMQDEPLPAEHPVAVAPVDDAPPSIAVLPFVNMSDEKANEHFGDGLAEELLNLLAQVPELHVAARTSTFYFKDKDATIADVAEALGVDTVLEGSIRRSGDTIRVVAQLISAEDERHLWSDKYDRPLTDVFAVQDDIARQIVDALLPRLEVEVPKVAEQGAISPEVYEQFLLARHTFYEGKIASKESAHEEFLAITQTAPLYGPGWTWLARSWLALPDTDPETAWAEAQAAIDVALNLNADDPRAYLELGRLAFAKGDNEAAVAEIDRALALDPRLVDALVLKEAPLLYLGRSGEAIETLYRARELDPLHPEVLSNHAHLLNLQGKTREAFAALDKLYRVNVVRAKTMEEHIYDDNEEVARAIYFTELDLGSSEPKMCEECFAFDLLNAGLYEHPIIQESMLRPIALANLGDRKATELALIEVSNEVNNPASLAIVRTMTYLSLEEYDMASDVLWSYWDRLEAQVLSDEFWEFHAMLLSAAADQAGQVERKQTMVPVFANGIAGWTKEHAGNYNMVNARLALLEGRKEDALGYLQAAAAAGSVGSYATGGPVLLQFQIPDEPRFDSVVAAIKANHDAQMQELERLRSSGLSAPELREEYLASLP